MNRTKIEWCVNPDGSLGWTWNPVTGCLNHIDGMCKGGGFLCYAYKLAHGRLKNRYLANTNIAPEVEPNLVCLADYKNPFYPRFWPEKLDIRRHYLPRDYRDHSSPRGIFVCSMSDLFGIGVPPSWTFQVMQMIRANPADRFYLLTKQPQNLQKFSPFPENVWVGVTATDTPMYQDACTYLARIEAKVRFISFEPLLAPIYLPILNPGAPYYNPNGIPFNWLIIGAQTNPVRMPNPEWVREIVEAADKAGVKVFLKDSLNCCAMAEYPFIDENGDLRQEFPVGAGI